MRQKFKIGVIAGAISIALTSSIYAEAAEEESAAEEEGTRITVTGSRIKRDNFDMPAPLIGVSREELQDMGSDSLQEILVETMPSLEISSSNTNTQSSITRTGLSTVTLRNLGSERTLILVDGRRVVGNSDSGVFGLSSIPSGMVERVEMITGGSSAVYGSDAVGGVINIITQTDKTGFEMKAKVGQTTEGGGERQTFEFNYGADVDDGRGYLYFSTRMDRDFGITYQDRIKRGGIELSHTYDDDEMCNAYRVESGDRECNAPQSEWRDRSDGIAGGVFDEGRDNEIIDGDFWFNEDGLQTGFLEERDGVRSDQWVYPSTPVDRASAAFKFDYQLTDDIDLYSSVMYSYNTSVNDKSPEDEGENQTVSVLDPVTLFGTRLATDHIGIDNPYMPAEIYNYMLADPDGKDELDWDRRMHEVGQVTTDQSRATFRSHVGLTGTVFDGEWDYDVSVGYGKFHQKLDRLNELNIFKLNQALDAEEVDGVIQCADADARAAGCVAINLFGVGSITPEMADWIRVNPHLDIELTRANGLGFISGDLAELPAGSLSAVFGYEFRRDEISKTASEGARLGGITYNIVPNNYADVNVHEAFGEFHIPLLADVAGARRLDLDTSFRFSNYSSEGVGTITSYNAGLFWEIIDGYAVRMNYSRSQRAPNMDELRTTLEGDYDGFDDICDGVTATSTGPGHANCRLDPGIAATIAEDGEFEEDGGSYYAPDLGNPNLKEETADTLTVGIGLTPIDDLTISIDYYDIVLKDAIENFSNEDILENCYDSPTVAFGTDNEFCGFITRDADGQFAQVVQQLFNLNEIRNTGYDFNVSYKHDLEVGRLSFNLLWQHLKSHSETVTGNDGSVETEYRGYASDFTFMNKATASIAYTIDDWRVRWRTSMRGSAISDQDYYENYLEAVEANDERCATGDADCVANPDDPAYMFLPSYVKHSLSVSYTMELDNNQSLRLSAGADNIFNNLGPFLESSRANSWSEYGRGKGRYVYFGADYRF